MSMNQAVPFQWLPNGLCLARLGVGLAFPLLPEPWRLWLIAGAALSDLLDGYLARRLHCESQTGQLLDPLADKTFVLMLVGTLLAEQVIPLGWAMALATRDLVVLAAVLMLALRRNWQVLGHMRPSWTGKVTTAFQFAVLLWAVWAGAVPVWLLATTSLLSGVAAVHYGLLFRRSLVPH